MGKPVRGYSTAERKANGQLTVAGNVKVLAKVIDQLEQGYDTPGIIAKNLNIDHDAAKQYKKLAMEYFMGEGINRAAIRALQLSRANRYVQSLLNQITPDTTLTQRLQIHDRVIKWYQHIASITGLNIETTVNVDATKPLVIIRSSAPKEIKEDKSQVIIHQGDVIEVSESEANV